MLQTFSIRAAPPGATREAINLSLCELHGGQRLHNRHETVTIRGGMGFTNSVTPIFLATSRYRDFSNVLSSSYPSLGVACLPSSLGSLLCSVSFGCKDQYERHTQRAGAFVTTLCLLLPAPGVASRGVALHRQCCHCGGLGRAGGRFVLWCICLGRQGLPGLCGWCGLVPRLQLLASVAAVLYLSTRATLVACFVK